MAKKKEQAKQKKSNSDIEKIAKRIKTLRQKKGYSNFEHFAYDNNFARTQYLRYESGEDMRVSTLLRIIKGLGITPKEFFSDDFEK